jgi:hypothetical protein
MTPEEKERLCYAEGYTETAKLFAQIDDLTIENEVSADQTEQSLQVVWEQINAALFDITEGDPFDAIDPLQNCIARLEALGVNK